MVLILQDGLSCKFKAHDGCKNKGKVYMMAAQTSFQSILTLKDHCKEAHQCQPSAFSLWYTNMMMGLLESHTLLEDLCREVYHSVHLLKLAHQAGR